MEIGLYVAPQQGATYDDQLAAARLAERCGYTAFVRPDHYRAFTGTGLPGPTDAWLTLCALARETSTGGADLGEVGGVVRRAGCVRLLDRGAQ